MKCLSAVKCRNVRSLFAFLCFVICMTTFELIDNLSRYPNNWRDNIQNFSFQESNSSWSTKQGNLSDFGQFDKVLEQPPGGCQKVISFGNSIDCNNYKNVCTEENLVPPFNSCTIYSFGAGHGISFELDISIAWGCEIFLHDFSINFTEKDLGPRIIFKKWGLANTSYISDAGVKFVTYEDALAANGHDKNTDVHYLKLDVQDANSEVLTDLVENGLLRNVWQLHMKIDVVRKKLNREERVYEMKELSGLMERLERIGFLRVRTRRNLFISSRNLLECSGGDEIPVCCNDILWVNERRRRERET